LQESTSSAPPPLYDFPHGFAHRGDYAHFAILLKMNAPDDDDDAGRNRRFVSPFPISPSGDYTPYRSASLHGNGRAMETEQIVEALPATTTPPPTDDARLIEYHLAALRRALAEPGEHRLYRAGKLPGLFPVRAGVCIDAALNALTENHLETVRTEAKGRQLTEWVRITPSGVAFVHRHDSPQAVLRELRETLGTTREGVPLWMHAALEEVTGLQLRFRKQAEQMISRLDRLAERVESALQRLDLDALPSAAFDVPWTNGLLSYLDRRRQAGATSACPLRELFQATARCEPKLNLQEFHTALLRLAEARTLQLHESADLDAEYVLFHANRIYGAAGR